jgi:CBS domain containing-hemolysin-like protein
MWIKPLIVGGALAAFAGASFFFALAETALFTLSPWQIRQLRERWPAAGQRVQRLRDHASDLLGTIVLGNTMANAGLVGLGFWLAFRQGWPLWAVLGLVLLLILVAGEVLPKTLAVRAPGFWALRVAPVVDALQRVSGPLRRLAQRGNDALLRRLVPRSVQPAAGTTTEEYRELLELAFEQGALQDREKEIILQIISLDRRTAKDVMRPRAEMAALPDDLDVAEMVAAARRLRHRRLPLYDESPDTIVGVLNTRRLLLDPGGDLAEAIEFPSFVPESMNLLALLRSLQRQKRGLAIVLDEFGSTAGVVTIEDILGSTVGVIRAEGEQLGFVMNRLGDGRWQVSGNLRLDDFRREHPALREVPGVDTLGGLVLFEAGVVPAVGESVTHAGLRLTVTQADERRVRELLVTRDGTRPGGVP